MKRELEERIYGNIEFSTFAAITPNGVVINPEFQDAYNEINNDGVVQVLLPPVIPVERMNLTGEELVLDIDKCPCCMKDNITKTWAQQYKEGGSEEYWECNECASDWELYYNEYGRYWQYINNDSFNTGFNPNQIPDEYVEYFEEGEEAFESYNTTKSDEYIECPYKGWDDEDIESEDLELMGYYWTEGFQQAARSSQDFE